jgi:hypothetical protein
MALTVRLRRTVRVSGSATALIDRLRSSPPALYLKVAIAACLA